MDLTTGCGACTTDAQRRSCALCAPAGEVRSIPVTATARRSTRPGPVTATARRSNRPTADGTASPQDDGYGRAKFLGDAAPVAGIPLSRLLNAACYVVSGIAIIVIGVQVGHGTAGAVALGLAAIAYGVYIALSRGSYWVSSWIYVLTIIAVLGMFGAFAR